MTTYTDRQKACIDRVREALPEFAQQDDYLLAHGASLTSESSHEIIHIDTLRKIVEAVLETTSPITGEPDGGARDVRGEAIYQVAFSDDDGGWNDASKHIYDSHPQHMRRIVYAAHSLPAAPAVRHSWAVNGMKRDPEGSWVLASEVAQSAAPSTAAQGATLTDETN